MTRNGNGDSSNSLIYVRTPRRSFIKKAGLGLVAFAPTLASLANANLVAAYTPCEEVNCYILAYGRNQQGQLVIWWACYDKRSGAYCYDKITTHSCY